MSHLFETESMFPYGVTGFLAGFKLPSLHLWVLSLSVRLLLKPKTRILHFKAINSIPLRILLFYVGALVCIIAVTSWAKVSPEKSPFVEMFTLVGLPIAAGLINFVVATSALSSANSGIFATSRMLYGLAFRQRCT